MLKYQIITYHHNYGYDEKEDTTTIKEAKEKAKKYLNIYELVYIYDKINQQNIQI